MAKTKDRTWQQKFMDVFKILTRSRQNWEVWSDFVHLAACSISNTLDMSHYDEHEEQYMHIISRYTKEEVIRRSIVFKTAATSSSMAAGYILLCLSCIMLLFSKIINSLYSCRCTTAKNDTLIFI